LVIMTQPPTTPHLDLIRGAQSDVRAFELDAVRNPLQLFQNLPKLNNVADASPMEAAVWRWKVLQALQGSLIAQFRARYGDRLVNENIMSQFHAAQWYQDIGPKDLTKVLDGTADALLKNVLDVFVRTRDKMTVRRSLSVLSVPHTDILGVVASMRVCLLQVRLLDPNFVPRVDEVLDTIERALDTDKELFVRTTQFDFVPREGVGVEEYFRLLHHRVGQLRGVDVRPDERRLLDLDKLIFADFSLSKQAPSRPHASPLPPPNMPYMPPQDSHVFPPPLWDRRYGCRRFERDKATATVPPSFVFGEIWRRQQEEGRCLLGMWEDGEC